MHTFTNKTMTGLLALVLPLSLGAFGCSGDKAKKVKETVSNLANDPKLNGKFADECSSSKLLDLSERLEMTFAGNQFTQEQVFYDNKDCKSEVGRIIYKGEFRIDSDALPQSEGGSIEVDLQDVRIRPKSQTFVDLANSVSLCGESNYEVDKAVSVKDQGDKPLAQITCPVQKVPVTLYGAYTLRDKKLVLSDGSVTAMSDRKDDRRTTLDHDHPYKRK